jgi:hypothetical protein
MKAADRNVENRLDALAAQTVDDISGNTGVYGRLDRIAVGLVHEHRDRPLRPAGHLKHLLQRVAARVFEIDQYDIGIDRGDARQKAVGIPDVMHDDGARLRQSLLEDSGTHGVLIDDQDL